MQLYLGRRGAAKKLGFNVKTIDAYAGISPAERKERIKKNLSVFPIADVTIDETLKGWTKQTIEKYGQEIGRLDSRGNLKPVYRKPKKHATNSGTTEINSSISSNSKGGKKK